MSRHKTRDEKTAGRLSTRKRTKDEQIAEGLDCLRLMEDHGMTMADVARRKHIAFNTMKQWVKEAVASRKKNVKTT